jgi:hypothetical protein
MKKYFTKRISILIIPALLAIGVSFGLSLATCQSSYGQVFISYTPPFWAPPYDNVSTVRYYYFPDYNMYYDVWDRQYYYLNGSDWIASPDLPPMWAGIDLSSSYVVLINRNQRNPWYNHDYYVRNYPAHGYDQYNNIVVKNRIITNIRPGHELVPRAYNENNRRVTFMQRPTQAPAPAGSAQPPRAAYHQQVHEVPIRSISPSMPPASRSLNYGGAQNRAPRSAPAPAAHSAPAPAAHSAPAPAPRSAPAQGGQHGGGGGKGR